MERPAIALVAAPLAIPRQLTPVLIKEAIVKHLAKCWRPHSETLTLDQAAMGLPRFGPVCGTGSKGNGGLGEHEAAMESAHKPSGGLLVFNQENGSCRYFSLQ